MRVLFWSTLFWPYIGGSEYFGAKLVSALRERGYELIVLTSHDYLDLPDETHYQGIPIYRLPLLQALRDSDASRFIEICQKVKKLKRTFKPDLVHLNGVNSTTVFHLRTVDAEPAATLVRVNQELLPHQHLGPETIFSQTLRSARWTTCVSSAVLKHASRLVPEIARRSSVIYNGLEVPSFSPTPLSFEAPRLMCVGRLVPAKGFDLALVALASIIKRYPNIRLVIAGDGPDRLQLERQTSQLGLSEVVEFLGLVEPEKVLALINRATLVLIPSRYEGLPTVALQAALMARPIVATRVGGLAEAVIDRQTGLLVESGDSHSLAEAIAFLLSNPQGAIEMGTAGRKRVQQLFLWQRCVDAYDALYKRLIARTDTGKSLQSHEPEAENAVQPSTSRLQTQRNQPVMMRVLFWSELFWPYIGGAEVFGTKLLHALRQRGHDVIVVTRQDSPDLPHKDQYQGIPVYRFPFLTAFANRSVDQLIAARQELAKLKREFAPDLVHIHGFGPSVLFHLDTTQAHPSPLLVTLVEERQHREGRDLLDRMLRAADWITGKSTAVLAQARRFVPEIATRSSVIQNGLAVPALLPGPLPTDAPRLLCLGRLAVQKGFDLALTALASIHDRFPHVRLTIAGDGPERPTLERQVSELGLTNVVDFIGWVSPDEIFALINTSSIVIMPSRWEGLPSVVLQAAIMARPVVATRVSGLSEVVAHQNTGLLVEPEDAWALAEAITSLLEQPEAAVRMGRAARRRVQELFSWERCVSAYEALWRRLVMDRRG